MAASRVYQLEMSVRKDLESSPKKLNLASISLKNLESSLACLSATGPVLVDPASRVRWSLLFE